MQFGSRQGSNGACAPVAGHAFWHPGAVLGMDHGGGEGDSLTAPRTRVWSSGVLVRGYRYLGSHSIASLSFQFASCVIIFSIVAGLLARLPWVKHHQKNSDTGIIPGIHGNHPHDSTTQPNISQFLFKRCPQQSQKAGAFLFHRFPGAHCFCIFFGATAIDPISSTPCSMCWQATRFLGRLPQAGWSWGRAQQRCHLLGMQLFG